MSGSAGPTAQELIAILKPLDKGSCAERTANCIRRALPSKWNPFPRFATWNDVLNATDSDLREIVNFGAGSLALWRKAYPARRFDPPPPPPQPSESVRAVIAMRQQGQTYQDIANALELSATRVMQLLARWAPELRGRVKV